MTAFSQFLTLTDKEGTSPAPLQNFFSGQKLTDFWGTYPPPFTDGFRIYSLKRLLTPSLTYYWLIGWVGLTIRTQVNPTFYRWEDDNTAKLKLKFEIDLHYLWQLLGLVGRRILWLEPKLIIFSIFKHMCAMCIICKLFKLSPVHIFTFSYILSLVDQKRDKKMQPTHSL